MASVHQLDFHTLAGSGRVGKSATRLSGGRVAGWGRGGGSEGSGVTAPLFTAPPDVSRLGVLRLKDTF